MRSSSPSSGPEKEVLPAAAAAADGKPIIPADEGQFDTTGIPP